MALAHRTILPGMGGSGDAMTPLIPFNMIVDTDVGLLSLIYKKFLDPRIFNKSYFEDKKVKDLVLDSYMRKEENPLTLCINEEYKDSCDTFYKQFMEREYKSIIDLSVYTEYLNVIRLFTEENDIHLTLCCKNDIEVETLQQYDFLKKTNILMEKDITPTVIKDKFKQYYFKSITDSISYAPHLAAKTVYFAGYGFNLDSEYGFTPHPAIEIIAKRNSLMVTEVYNMNKLRGETNGE